MMRAQDPGETILINLFSASRITITNPATTITINLAGPPTVQFSEATLSVAENVDLAALTVQLSRAATEEIVIPITLMDGTALVTDDYLVLPPTSVTFADGEMEQTFNFPISDDDLVEPDETFTVSFGTLPDGVTAGSTTSVTVTIISDDSPVLERLAPIGNAVEVTAGESFPITLRSTNGALVNAGFFAINIIGSSSGFRNVEEFSVTDADGNPAARNGFRGFNLSLPAGREMWTMMLTAADDGDTEAESTTIEISVEDNVATLIRTSFMLTINPFPALSVAAAPILITEGEDSTITITADRTPAGDLTIPFTIGGTDIAAGDYTLTDASGTELTMNEVTLPASQTSVALTLTAVDDADTDPEMLTFTLNTPASGAAYTVPTTGAATTTVTINPTEAALTVQFSAATLEVTEGTDSMATVTVQLSAAASEEIIVPVVTMDGTGSAAATAGNDYTALSSGSVTFADGDRSQTIEIEIIDDTEVESNETFTVSLGDLTGLSVTAGTPTSVEVTIVSEDMLPELVIPPGSRIARQTITEGDPPRTLMLALSRPVESSDNPPVVINLAHTTETARFGPRRNLDFTLPETLSFAVGEQSKEFTFTVIDEDDPDDNFTENATILVHFAGFGVVRGAFSFQVTITDN